MAYPFLIAKRSYYPLSYAIKTEGWQAACYEMPRCDLQPPIRPLDLLRLLPDEFVSCHGRFNDSTECSSELMAARIKCIREEFHVYLHYQQHGDEAPG